MRLIADGMVAENSAVWRVSGVFLQDLLDVVDKAHAQHLVGFVQHQASQLRQVERAFFEVVDHAARACRRRRARRA